MSARGKKIDRRVMLRSAGAVSLTGILAACAKPVRGIARRAAGRPGLPVTTSAATSAAGSSPGSGSSNLGGVPSTTSMTTSSSTPSLPTVQDLDSSSGAQPFPDVPTSSSTSSSAEPIAGSANPFGVTPGSSVRSVVFDGGYGYDYVTFAAKQAERYNDGVTFDVKPSTKIASELQPQFIGGNPPELFDNSGADRIDMAAILDQLADLSDVFQAPNYEGTTIADTLYGGVRQRGTFGDKFAAVNYVMTLYGIWYSGSLFEENGWTPPKTWDEAIELGAKAKKAGKYLFVWGKEAATYYEWFAINSAIKQGGDEVRLALENLESNAWSHPAIQGVFKALETCVKKGYFVPGGASTQFTKAQAMWSNDQKALLYPSGSWIENEMANATKDGFKMKGVPEFTLDDSPAYPYESLRAGAGEPYLVPSTSENPAGGRELLRAMMSKKAATNFARTRLAPTIVSGTVPPDGFGSTALASSARMLDAAGNNVFNYQFIDYYGLNSEQIVVWNAFLSGKTDAKGLTSKLQKISDDAAS